MDKLPPWLMRQASRVRKAALVVVLLGATAYFLDEMNGHYLMRRWLFFDYAGYWALTVGFNVACFSAGYRVLRAILPAGIPLRERAVLSMAVGVFAFYLGAFLAGLMHLYGRAFFTLWPTLLIAAGAVPLFRLGRRMARAMRGVRRTPARRSSLLDPVLLGSGVIALFVIYLVVMTPENIAFDARWYHLPIAEAYASWGAVRPFQEGWFQGTLPHLSSFLYTWAMLWPREHIVDRSILCSHIEFSLFLWTLYGVTVLTRRLVPGRRLRFAWVAVFLFPGIFLYDSNLNTTADHIAAFWAPPIFLALLRAWPRLDLRWCLVLAVCLAGGLSTKYQTASLVMFPAIAIALRSAWLSVRRGWPFKWAPLGSALAAGGCTVVLWAPHWLKNLIWYGDPFYPLLHGRFASRPWTPDNDQRFATMASVHLWRPTGTLQDRLLETLKALWTFSFEPHDWGPTHHDFPVFGCLFTLSMLALPFVRARRRLWALYGAGNAGVLLSYWTSHQDRYLQALVPWFAAATAATIVLAWRSGLLPRIAVSLLVLAQVVWGGDIPFFGTHRMLNTSPIKVAMDRITSGFDRDLDRRRRTFGDLVELGEALPPNSLVLVHDEEIHLGLGHPSVNDDPDWQGALSYGRMRSPADLDDHLRALGITHIAMVTGHSRDLDYLPGDIAFFDYVTHFARNQRKFGGWSLFDLPAQRPPEEPYGNILWLGCGNRFAMGRYRPEDMQLPFYGPALRAFPPPRSHVAANDGAAIERESADVSAVAIDPQCESYRPSNLGTAFEHVTNREKLEVWIRRRASLP